MPSFLLFWLSLQTKNAVREARGVGFEVGGLRFEGEDFTIWPKYLALFVVYSTTTKPNGGRS